MIFNTITDDITGATKSISIFNSTLSTIKKNIKNGQGITYSIFSGNKLNQKDIQAIINYANALKDGANLGKAWKDNISNCSVAAKQYVLDAKKAGKSTDELVDGLKNVPKTAKAATVATKALSVALNMVAMWAITEAIGAVVTYLNSYTEAAANAKEGSEALTQKMKDFDSKVCENAKTLKELNPQYQKLSKGVNELGENINDSTEEYEEYKDIVQQVSDIMPGLSVRFNSQGEAIAFTDGKLKDLTKTYEEYRKKAAEKFLSEGDGEGHTVKDIVDNYQNQTDRAWYDDFWSRLKTNGGWINRLSGSSNPIGQGLKLIGGANNPIIKGVTSFFGLDASLEDLLEQEGRSNREKKKVYESFQKLSKEKFGEITQYTNILGYDVKDIANMSDKEFNEFKKILQQEADHYGNEIEAAADSMKHGYHQKIRSKR